MPGIGRKSPFSTEFMDFTRGLRRNSTDAEAIVWQWLRRRRLGGVKFRRQHPYPPYVLDFYCHELKLAVELDGGHHIEAQKYDARREAFLSKEGIRVLRFWDHDVLLDTETVLDVIYHEIMSGSGVVPSPQPSPGGRGDQDPQLGANGGTVPSPQPSPGGRGGQILRIKVCGITRLEDGLAAAEAGADAIGLVFYPPSPRHVTPEQAAAIVAGLPPFVVVVGLFVNPQPGEVEAVLVRCPLDRIQLHGEESPETCARMPRPVIKAIRVGGDQDLQGLERYPVSGLLLDAKVKGIQGGSGQAFDWGLLEGWRSPKPMILAGGLDPGNVAEAVARVRPYGVDVSSGVESSPGIKDAARIKAFVDEAGKGLR